MSKYSEWVDLIPGKDGFWKEETREVYEDAMENLVSLGMAEVEAYDFLFHLYHVTGGEFGE